MAAIAFNSFSATGSDASGYLSHASMLLEGTLTHAEPLAPLATWHDGGATLAPLGWRATGMRRAGADLLDWPAAVDGASARGWWSRGALRIVVPLSLAVTVVVVAALAYRVGRPAAAIVAAVWMATSPVALVESMQIMSDVPVTAAWLVCWWFVLRNQSLGAGLAAAAAVLIRPNLAPLALLPALVAFTRRGGAPRWATMSASAIESGAVSRSSFRSPSRES